MQGLILAAGLGSRLKKLTQNQTKGMVEVNGVSMMERMLRQLDQAGLSRIVVVTGYAADTLRAYIDSLAIQTPVIYVHNDIYDQTNNIYSVALAEAVMTEDDTVMLESDLIFDQVILDGVLADARPNLMLVDRYQRWMDGTCVQLNAVDEITAFIPGAQFDFTQANTYYKTVNIYKLSKEFAAQYYFPFLKAYMAATGVNQYYESVFKTICELSPQAIVARRVTEGKWYEVDDVQDLDIAGTLFTSPSDQLAKMQKRFGGYWRYPNVLDYCYLVNPYFPPKQMVEELKYNFQVLMEQYPSGQGVNSFLAAKYFGLNPNYVVVGNGAAELIKVYLEHQTGKIGFIRPTFEEYPNRYDATEQVIYQPEQTNFRYDATDIQTFFTGSGIQALVLINPDNPSGNYIDKAGIMQLLEWTKSAGITFVLDESFVDFADELEVSMLTDELLEANPQLIVVKSISKSYGVPGFRLGILASSQTTLISTLRQQVSIWNINSFGEYYLQIFGKYQKAYAHALQLFRQERKRFVTELEQIEAFRVLPSQANYLMIEVLEGTSLALSEALLANHEIIIKDLTPKLSAINRQFIRIAVRNQADNERLVQAIKSFYQE